MAEHIVHFEEIYIDGRGQLVGLGEGYMFQKWDCCCGDSSDGYYDPLNPSGAGVRESGIWHPVNASLANSVTAAAAATTYFRVQDGRRDINDLLDPDQQISHAYSGHSALNRTGVSACESLEELALYLASPQGSGIAQSVTDGWVIVEMEADPATGGLAPVDPIEVLVRPTAIVNVRPVDDAFRALIAAQNAFLDSFVEPDPFADEEEAP